MDWEAVRDECRGRWLDTAQSLRPKLSGAEVRPAGTVEVVPDASAFQGWRVAPAEKATDLVPGAEFVLDFGEHLVGRVTLRFESRGRPADSPLRLALVFAEAPAEAAEPFDPHRGWLSRSWLQDEILNVDRPPLAITLPRRYAFRYLKVRVLHVPEGEGVRLRLGDVSCRTETSAAWDLEPYADARIPAEFGDIDRASLKTLRNCMQDVFEDGPKRDRRLWLGDLRLEALGNYATFRNTDLVKRCLYLHAGLASDEGWIHGDAYADPPATGGWAPADYALLFGPALLDYLEATGDETTAADLFPAAWRQVELALALRDESGAVRCTDVFVDWHPDLDRAPALHGVALYAVRRMGRLAARLGFEGEAARCEEWTGELLRAAGSVFRDDASGLFLADDGQVSWASQVWMILGGAAADDEARSILRRLPDVPDAVTPGGPYLYHHVVEAMLACGLEEQALNVLREYWGGMIARGADTFWEVFRPGDDQFSPYGNHLINSYCHAWSCTPAYFLRRIFCGHAPGENPSEK